VTGNLLVFLLHDVAGGGRRLKTGCTHDDADQPLTLFLSRVNSLVFRVQYHTVEIV
jgi:hypothetical protein